MSSLRRPDGRTVAYDDVGAPDGVPVVYLHGTPDSRLARHPDDDLAAAAGVRLVAVDRPGYGGTSPLRPHLAAPGAAEESAAPLERLGDGDRSPHRSPEPAGSTDETGGSRPGGSSPHRSTDRLSDAAPPSPDPGAASSSVGTAECPPSSDTSGQGPHRSGLGDSGGHYPSRAVLASEARGREPAGPIERVGGSRLGHSFGFAGDLVAVLDHLGIDRAVLVAWSGGALDGLAAAADSRLGGRLRSVHVVAGLVPREAYDDPDVREAGEHRLGLIEMADSLPPAELAEAVAPMLAPWPCDHALALEHQADHREPADQAALATIPGAVDRLADGLVEAVRHGLAGVEADVRAQVQPGVVDPSAVTVPVHLWYGTADTVTPPAFGRWFASQLPKAELHLVEDASHYLPFTHWGDLLTALRG